MDIGNFFGKLGNILLALLMTGTFAVVSFIYLAIHGCLYKAGNRQPDLNQRYKVNVSPYYLQKFLTSKEGFEALYNDGIATSEMINYHRDFVPIKDPVHNKKYVIEFHYFDSFYYIKSPYINLSSLFDYNTHRWIREKDSLKNNELNEFKIFFTDSVINPTIKKFKHQTADSLLIDKKNPIQIKEYE